jgi:predicted Zn finger-like uncharacterized protein
MQTRCPHCQTRFRVTTEQLKLRQGQVRCGACHAVFDALDSLSDELLVALPSQEIRTESSSESQPLHDGTVAPQPASVPVEPVIPVDLIEVAANEATDANEVNEPAPEIDVEIDLQPESLLEEDGESPAEPELEALPETEAVPEPVVELEPEAVPEPAQETSAEVPAAPEESPPVPVVKPARRWPWIIGSVALLLVGAAQLAYLFRVELAVVAPAMRPALVAGCELLGCDLPRPRKPDQIDIEASDLAPQGAGLLLTATLRNRAPFEQEYPHLELTLTDTQDVPLMRKVLLPTDYLPNGQTPDAGFAARGAVDIKLALVTDNVPAVGYRLYFFFP